MLLSYFRVALRVFRKNGAFSLINLAGLTLGISTCLLIILFILDELSFDTYHENADRIYRLTEILHLPKEERHQSFTSPPMGPALEANFPEVLHTTRLTQSRRTLANGEKKFYDARIWYSDSALFDIFSFPMIAGNPKTALVEPYSIVLTETSARRFFDQEDPLGKTLIFSETMPVVVTGVIRDIPDNSHLKFDVMLSRTTWTAILNGESEDNWFDNGYYTYVLLAGGADANALEKKFADYARNVMAPVIKETGLSYDFKLQPLTDIHLRSAGILYSTSSDGDIRYIYIFSFVAFLVLLVACANYVNLSTARAVRRAREIGMRKVIGARRGQLVAQIMGESFLVTTVSTTAAIVLVIITLPWMSQFVGKELEASYLLDGSVLSVFAMLFVTVVLVAGAYPAFLISSYTPVDAMKIRTQSTSGSAMLRKGLVVFQFCISIVMIAMTILVFKQMRFIQQKDLGLQKDQVVVLPYRPSVVFEVPVIKRELLQVPGVLSTSSTNFSYAERASSIAMLPDGAESNQATSINIVSADEHFLETLGIDLVAGRNLFERRRDFDPADSTSVLLVNETAVRDFGWGTPEDALSRFIRVRGGRARVVGVVKDFHFHSLHERIKPLVIFNEFMLQSYIAVKIHPSNVSETLKGLEMRWKEMRLDSPFSFSFLDADFENMYRKELRLQGIIAFLSFLSIFIAALGLFGLVAFMAEQRTKEIGVRKVLGASVISVVALLSRDFFKLLGLALMIAMPLSWIVMTRWIQGFAFQVELSVWTIVWSGLACLVITLLTAGIQSVRAASANPVVSLKND